MYCNARLHHDVMECTGAKGALTDFDPGVDVRHVQWHVDKHRPAL